MAIICHVFGYGLITLIRIVITNFLALLNYPNNYFVAPESWHDCFYTTSRKNMLLLSRGIENIVRVKPPFNKFVLLSLFQRVSNFNNSVKEQYTEMAPLTKKLYLIGAEDSLLESGYPIQRLLTAIVQAWKRTG
jgi:hypothetical protein